MTHLSAKADMRGLRLDLLTVQARAGNKSLVTVKVDEKEEGHGKA